MKWMLVWLVFQGNANATDGLPRQLVFDTREQCEAAGRTLKTLEHEKYLTHIQVACLEVAPQAEERRPPWR